MDLYLKVLKNYVGFRGRARRKEYWMFILVNIIFTFVLGLLDKMLGWQRAGGEGILTTIYGILVFLPWWAVQFRRLHDTGRSGWWWGAGIIATYAICIILAIDLGISSLIHFPPAAVSAFLGKFILFAILISKTVQTDPGPVNPCVWCISHISSLNCAAVCPHYVQDNVCVLVDIY